MKSVSYPAPVVWHVPVLFISSYCITGNGHVDDWCITETAACRYCSLHHDQVYTDTILFPASRPGTDGPSPRRVHSGHLAPPHGPQCPPQWSIVSVRRLNSLSAGAGVASRRDVIQPLRGAGWLAGADCCTWSSSQCRAEPGRRSVLAARISLTSVAERHNRVASW